MRGVALTFLAVLLVGSAAWAIVPTGSPGFSASGVRAGVLVAVSAMGGSFCVRGPGC